MDNTPNTQSPTTRRKLSLANYKSPHMDNTYSEAEQAALTAPPIQPRTPAGSTEREVNVLIDILDNISSLLSEAQDNTDRQAARIKAQAKVSSKSHAYPDYFLRLAYTLHKLEQLLWIYCDSSWLRKSDVLRKLSTDTGPLADAIEVRANEETVLIRMPHISPVKSRTHSMPEDLLLCKLSKLHDLPRFEKCHATFCHVYPKKRSQLPKDVGNYDYKRTIDVLGYVFGFSDCAATFSMTLESMLTDDLVPGTYILLESKVQRKFRKRLWINSAKSSEMAQSLK